MDSKGKKKILNASEMGHKRWEGLTPEQRKEISKMLHKAKKDKKNGAKKGN